ncbi:MAG: class I SAM-dependent methyltransferase [Nanoarchaeota archaeon]
MLFKEHNIKRSENVVKQFKGLIDENDTVLDVGLGNGIIADYIKKVFKANIEGVDVVDYNETDIKNTIYDGLYLPFANNSYDCVLILETLHHCTDFKLVLKEAKRVVKKRVIIMEDIHEGIFEKYLLLFHDYISNIRKGVSCPYNFQSREKWRGIFTDIGMKIEIEKDYISKFLFFDSKHVIFPLSKG